MVFLSFEVWVPWSSHNRNSTQVPTEWNFNQFALFDNIRFYLEHVSGRPSHVGVTRVPA
jgi:hypothetical protein